LSLYRLANVEEVRFFLSYLHISVLDRSTSNDIFLEIEQENSGRDGNLFYKGWLYVYDRENNQRFRNRVKTKHIKILLDWRKGEKLLYFPGRTGERIKTVTVSLGYGRTFYKKTKDGYKKLYGRYSVTTDFLLDKWPADRKELIRSF
jgi:hypothetical protein